jgi:hypothetical protein
VLPWLLAGGTLVLHHPFDAAILAKTRHDERCRTLILPASVAFRLAETNLFAREGPTTVVAAWRAPERLAASTVWRASDAVLVDVPIFGEAGLLAARRQAGGEPAPLALGPVHAPRDGGESPVTVAELAVSDTGTLAWRGPMVPHYPFPPGVERSAQPHFEIGRGGLIDSGYVCRVDHVTGTLAVTAAPAGIVSVGGYRFALCGLLEAIGRIDRGATLAALPDALIGQRLLGETADRDAMTAALDAAGLNPLVAAAFHDRKEVSAEKLTGH